MTKPECDFAIAGVACRAVLEAMMEFGYVPASHLDHVKRVIAEHEAACKAWKDSMEPAYATH